MPEKHITKEVFFVQSMERVAFTVSEAAAALGISRPTMYKIIRREDFPAFRVGTRTLIPRAGLERWVEQQAEVGS